MRLLLAYRDDVDVHGGAARVMTETAEALRALGAEVDVTFDARPDANGYDAVVAVNVWQPQSALAQLRHLRGQGVPIVWLPIYLGYEEFAWAAPAVRQIFHGDRSDDELRRLLDDFAAGRYEVDLGDGTLRRDARNEVHPGFYDELQAMLDLVDHVCVVSHHEVQAIARAAQRFAKPFTLARHGVDAELFARAGGDAFREAFDIDGDFVLCVGAVDTRKNQLLLIEALRDTDLQLVLVGPSFEPDYLELCLERGGDDVRRLDRIPRELVASALKAAAVHALPSWAEGAALASMEAAAAGTPIVVSNRTSEFEYFGDLAQFCDPGDPASIRAAVLAALDSRFTRPELPALLAERMRGFTWREAGEAVLSACERARSARPTSERRGVAVLGMHRSGTSAATRLVSLLGLPLSPDEDQIPVDEKNPTGYWESASLVAWNNDILAAIDCDPWTAPALDHGWERDWRLEALRRDAAAAFDRVFPGEQWVWKDPRACLTLPFWREVTGYDPVCLIVVRNPLEVARSLATREGFSTAHSVALWERYTRAAIAAATGRPTRVTTYEQLLGDPHTWCAETAAFLRAHGVPAEDASPEAIAGFVDPTLRHSSFQASALLMDPAVSAEQHTLYQRLVGTIGDHAAYEPPSLPDETPSIDQLLAGRRRAYLAERGDALDLTLSELLGESIRRVVTIARADDLATSPELLAAYTAAFRSDDDATLVVLADDVAAATQALLRAAANSGADVETGPDMLVATAPPGTEELIAQAVTAQLSERPVIDGPFAHVPRMNARRLLDLAHRCRAAQPLAPPVLA